MKKIILLPLLLCAVHFAIGQVSPTKVRMYKKTFKTYDFSDPDPIAKPGAIYPYFRFDGYTDQAVNKEWKVIELENEFIKVMILPEIGGKIWAAWDKATGKSFVYNNQVVKFRDVSMRGPWTSGGIEANYGIIGHTPNCATPMDYLTEEHEDGSASAVIGTLDLLTQTYWTIDINLPKDKAYFTTKSFWNNSTPFEQPYYTWMNAGIKAAGNLEFVYPGNRYIGHAGEYASWKINKENGKDISFYEQNNFGTYKSYHVFGQYADFFGAFWHKENFGMGRFATHDEKAGKKIWIWGLSPQGMIWENLLSDTDGQYVEVQSGRLFNQSAEASTLTPFKHLGFAPATTDTWTEYWFPVKDTKGFVEANPFGALNVRVENGYLKLNFSPLQNFSDELKVTEAGKPIYSRQVTFKTLQAFADSVAFTGKADELVVTVGKNRMEHKTNYAGSDLNRPVDSPASFDWNSVQGLYIQGKENLRQRLYPQAEEKLLATLAKDPHYLPALGDMAMLMWRKMEYTQSLDYARHALSIDTYDPAGNFYYGLANLELGHLTDARDGFDIASLDGAYRGAALVELAKIYFRLGDTERAISYAEKSLRLNSENVGAWQVVAVACRISGQAEKEKTVLTRLAALNPLNHFIRFENYRIAGTPAAKNQFTFNIRNEMPQETYLQLADWFTSLGLHQESLEVLQCAPVHPEVLYWTAWLKSKLGQDGSSDLIHKANQLSPALVFPFRSSSAEVLKWVSSQTPDWKPKYYLGLIYWSRHELAKAKEWFAQCEPDYAPFYASRAALFNSENVEADLRKAAELDPSQWRFGKLLINRFLEVKNYAEALKIAQNYHTRFPKDFRLSMLLAKTLLMNKQYKACSDLLGTTKILPYEGATDGRQLYHEAWLMQAAAQYQSKNYNAAQSSVAAARRWPENLGVGRPYTEDIDERLENYIDALSFEKQKKHALAVKKWNEAVAFKASGFNINTLVAALSMKELNRATEGEQLLNDWIAKDPNSTLAKWSLEVYKGNKPSQEITGNENLRVVKVLMGI